MLNPNTKVDPDILLLLYQKDISIIDYSGNASKGFTEEHLTQKAISLLDAKALSLNLPSLAQNVSLLPSRIINENYIDEYLWEN